MGIKKSEIDEQVRYVFKCPDCGGTNELCEYNEKVICEHCLQEIILEELNFSCATGGKYKIFVVI